MNTGYPYATGDLLAQPNTYFYSAFGGEAFLEAWEASRAAMQRWCMSVPLGGDVDGVPSEPVAELFSALAQRLAAGDETADAPFAGLVQRFEITKRVYGAYDLRWRAADAADYRVLSRYVSFGELLVAAYAASGRLDALNALLKLNDVLSAHREDIAPADRPRVAVLLRAERVAVHAVSEFAGASR